MKRSHHVRLLVVPALLAFAVACSETQKSPLSPSAAAGTGAAGAAADGSTLKVSAPTPGAPAGGGRIDTRRPTFTWSAASGQYTTSVAPGYRLEVLDASGALLDSRTLGAGVTSFTADVDLAFDRVYQWRVRAELDGAVGPWSSTASFQTPVQPPPPEGSLAGPRVADPPPGGRLATPGYILSILNDEYNRNRNDWNNSCQERQGERGWIWLDKLIDRLRTIDTRWGYNGKRGNANDPSQDVIVYHWGGGASENSTAVYIFDVMLGHCGSTPSPTFIDQTAITLNSGTIGRYVWRRPGRTTPPYYLGPVQ